MSDELPKDPITSGIQTLPARGRLPNDGRRPFAQTAGGRRLRPIPVDVGTGIAPKRSLEAFAAPSARQRDAEAPPK